MIVIEQCKFHMTQLKYYSNSNSSVPEEGRRWWLKRWSG